VRFTPSADYNGTATFNFYAWDQTSGSAGGTADVTTRGGTTAFSSTSDTATITINAVNDAPVLTDQANTLTTITETDTNNSGDPVASIIHDSAITDADLSTPSNAPEAIAVYSVDNTNGTWQYSTDNGSTWTDFGSVSANSARLLDGSLTGSNTHKIRFVPNGSGAPYTTSISFRAWDKTSGSAGGTADITTNGGSTAFSSATDTADLQVNASGAPTISSIARLSPSAEYTNADTVTFRVTFSEAVQNVDATDFEEAAGGASGTIASVTAQSTSVYDVQLTGVSGDGVLDLNVKGSHDITDGTNPYDGNVGSEENYQIDNTAPALDLDPSNGTSTSHSDYYNATGSDVSIDDAGDALTLSDASDRIETITISISGLDTDGDGRIVHGGANSPLVVNPTSGNDVTHSNQTVNGVAGVDLAWDSSSDTLTITKNGGGVFTATEARDILRGLSYDNNAPATATQGDRVFTITATDDAGNSTSATSTITVDTVAPTAPTVTTDTTNDTTPTITGTATLGAGETLTVTVNGVTYTNGDGNLSASGGNWTLTIPSGNALGAGTYAVTATVTDAAGNVTSDATTNELVIDTTAPVIDLDPSNGASTSHSDTFGSGGAAVSLDDSGDEATLDEASDEVANIKLQVTGLDASGNEKLDYGSGQLSINSGSDASVSNVTVNGVSGVDITWTSANDTVTITKNGGGNFTAAQARDILRGLSYDNTTPASAGQGNRVFSITATDDAGNTSTAATSTVTVETVGPAIDLAPSDGASIDHSAYYNSSRAVVSLDDSGDAATLTEASDAVANLKLQVTGLDASNDEKLDYGSGQLSINSGSDASVSNVTVNGVSGVDITWTSANNTATITRNGGGNFTAAQARDILRGLGYDNTGTPSQGDRVFSITAEDSSGLTTSTAATATITVDTTIPATPAAPDLTAASDTGPSDTDNITTDDTPTFTGTGATPGWTVTLYDTDGTTVLGTVQVVQPDGSWEITTGTLTQGTHSLTVTYTDPAGNKSPRSLPLDVEIVAVETDHGETTITPPPPTDTGGDDGDGLVDEGDRPGFGIGDDGFDSDLGAGNLKRQYETGNIAKEAESRSRLGGMQDFGEFERNGFGELGPRRDFNPAPGTDFGPLPGTGPAGDDGGLGGLTPAAGVDAGFREDGFAPATAPGQRIGDVVAEDFGFRGEGVQEAPEITGEEPFGEAILFVANGGFGVEAGGFRDAFGGEVGQAAGPGERAGQPGEGIDTGVELPGLTRIQQDEVLTQSQPQGLFGEGQPQGQPGEALPGEAGLPAGGGASEELERRGLEAQPVDEPPFAPVGDGQPGEDQPVDAVLPGRIDDVQPAEGQADEGQPIQVQQPGGEQPADGQSPDGQGQGGQPGNQ
jgi:hypothetical protein